MPATTDHYRCESNLICCRYTVHCKTGSYAHSRPTLVQSHSILYWCHVVAQSGAPQFRASTAITARWGPESQGLLVIQIILRVIKPGRVHCIAVSEALKRFNTIPAMNWYLQMPTAYVFIHCTAGSEKELISEIAKIEDVREVRGTYGIHDIFVKVKSKDSQAMNKVVSESIRKMKGVISTNTLIAIEEQGGKEYSDAVALIGK
jgi:DNA-binding Lrp family transcriptional regulator